MLPNLDFSFLQNRAAPRRIAAIALAFMVAGLAYALLAPRWYRSVLTVVPAKAQKAGISSLLGGDLAALAPGLDASTTGADAPRIAAVLESIAVSDAVIEKFALRERYSEKYQESAREALWRHCSVKTLPKPNLVQLSCEDKDPRFVQQMLAYFSEYGNRVFRGISVSSASEEAKFLEKRVAELRRQADEAAGRMREFQEQHNIVDLDSQAKAVVSSLAALHSQRIAKQVELQYARTFSSGDEATAQQLRSQLSVVADELRDLEHATGTPSAAARDPSPGASDVRTGVFPRALEVPKLRAEYEALFRDRKVAEATLIVALERLEVARANEARDTSSFLVLDPPTVATRHSRPRRLLTVILFTVLGAAGAVALEWCRGAGTLSAALSSAWTRVIGPSPSAGRRVG